MSKMAQLWSAVAPGRAQGATARSRGAGRVAGFEPAQTSELCATLLLLPRRPGILLFARRLSRLGQSQRATRTVGGLFPA